jgi:CheY-like chemotaxis protein
VTSPLQRQKPQIRQKCALSWLIPFRVIPVEVLSLPGEASPCEITFPSASSARLLVVDDNADMRSYLEHLLAPHYILRLVNDGTSALEVARQWSPDLIISDVMMPGLDGFALLAALNADPQLHTIPVILLSARADRVGQVVINYLTNALKYSPADSPVAVSLNVEDAWVGACLCPRSGFRHCPKRAGTHLGSLLSRSWNKNAIWLRRGARAWPSHLSDDYPAAWRPCRRRERSRSRRNLLVHPPAG